MTTHLIVSLQYAYNTIELRAHEHGAMFPNMADRVVIPLRVSVRSMIWGGGYIISILSGGVEVETWVVALSAYCR